ncbi:MAG: lactate utilization protein [Bacteroidia bacterium]|nr:lactate utilization protein [Bacteroidia bacterium]
MQQLHLESGTRQFSNLELARERAAFIRWKTIENLDKYLIEFESNIIKSGAKVIWAQDITDALEAVLEILKKAGARSVIKSKTNTATEIGLNAYLETQQISVVESDTGDFIVDASGEGGSHMVLPALHKSSREIAGLLHEKHQLPADAEISGIVNFIRDHLRDTFRTADAGITGCNFLLADPGAVVILENEGNAQLSASLPKTHIVLAGIEKMLPSLGDLDLFLPLLSTYGTGQALSTYNSIITGPRQTDEQDGPEELYVILIDNGRSDVLAHDQQRQAMTCIKCGACQTVCPVYRSAGASEFPSPIAAITLPLQGSEHQHLSHSSTLCGACKDVCPVKIDIPRLLLENRKYFVDKGQVARSERWFYFAWKKAMLKREIMSWTGISPRKHILESLFKSQHGLRKMPSSTKEKSFNDWYREKMNYK